MIYWRVRNLPEDEIRLQNLEFEPFKILILSANLIKFSFYILIIIYKTFDWLFFNRLYIFLWKIIKVLFILVLLPRPLPRPQLTYHHISCLITVPIKMINYNSIKSDSKWLVSDTRLISWSLSLSLEILYWYII